MKAGKSVTESTTEVSEVNEMSHGKALAKMIMAKQSKHPIAQHMGEAKDPGEYDYEGDMAMSQLKSVIANAQKLHDMMDPDTNLPEWVQAKITLAEDYIVTAANYMDGQMDESAFAELDAELELFEKAPPGSKYERMVKHIKKGYSAGGLTPKEKSIAYATAWKAYNKANEETETTEEVEQIDEARLNKMSLKDLWHAHSTSHYYSDQGSGPGIYSMHGNEKAANVIKKHVAKKYGDEVANDMETHSGLQLYSGEYGSGKEAKEADRHAAKLRKKHNISEEAEQIEEKYMGFKAVQKAVAAKGARNPAAVAAAIGRKKYGKEKFQAMAAAGKKAANEEVEQIDELKDSTLKSYVKKANKEMNKAFKYHKMDQGGRDGTDPEYMKKTYPWALAKFDRRDAGVEKAKQKLAKEETEGSVPTNPKEKELAAHHGDPNRITYGDVIKARLKAAAKKGN
jgi:hypothetical protein